MKPSALHQARYGRAPLVDLPAFNLPRPKTAETTLRLWAGKSIHVQSARMQGL